MLVGIVAWLVGHGAEASGGSLGRALRRVRAARRLGNGLADNTGLEAAGSLLGGHCLIGLARDRRLSLGVAAQAPLRQARLIAGVSAKSDSAVLLDGYEAGANLGERAGWRRRGFGAVWEGNAVSKASERDAITRQYRCISKRTVLRGATCKLEHRSAAVQGKREKKTGGQHLLEESPGDLPRSGGLASCFCSNIARKFLTADMATVSGRCLATRYSAKLSVEAVREVGVATSISLGDMLGEESAAQDAQGL